VLCRHMKIRLDWVAENAANELLSSNATQLHRTEWQIPERNQGIRCGTGWLAMSNPDSGISDLPHLSHSRLQKYITCPEQYRLYYLERLRPKQEAAARVFGAVMHLALAEYFRKERDPLATFREEWTACQKFQLRYSQRESWQKLNQIGEALLQEFLAEEARKFEQVFAVEAKFHIGASNVAAPLVGTLDLVAQLEGKRTLVQDWGQRLGGARCAPLRPAHRLSSGGTGGGADCDLRVGKKARAANHLAFTERTPEQQVEYLRKMEIVSLQITDRVFYKRVGFWCRQCEFLPVCTRNEKKVRETLVRIG